MLFWNKKESLVQEELDWKSLELFDPQNLKHQEFGDSIIDLCRRLMKTYGRMQSSKSYDDWKYQDGLIKINGTPPGKPYQDLSGIKIRTQPALGRVTVTLIDTNRVVASWSANVKHGMQHDGDGESPYTHYHKDFHRFRLGDWIDHVNALRSKVEQAENEVEEQRKQAELEAAEQRKRAELLEQQRRYGRIGNSSIIANNFEHCAFENQNNQGEKK